MWGNTVAKKKNMWENIATIHSVLKKKSIKQNSQSQYEKNKIDKDHLNFF